MNLKEKFNDVMTSRTIQNFKGTAMLKLFGLTKIPLIFLVNPSVKELSEDRCAIENPLNRLTRNHLGSMYFGTLAIGADCAGGLFAMYKADQIKTHKFSLVFKDFKANFLKRPENDVQFICTDSKTVEQLLNEAKTTGERATHSIRIEARVPAANDELVAEFELGLSLKASVKKS
jgi:hypothetical protein